LQTGAAIDAINAVTMEEAFEGPAFTDAEFDATLKVRCSLPTGLKVAFATTPEGHGCIPSTWPI
jgi:hypothetical protein